MTHIVRIVNNKHETELLFNILDVTDIFELIKVIKINVIDEGVPRRKTLVPKKREIFVNRHAEYELELAHKG